MFVLYISQILSYEFQTQQCKSQNRVHSEIYLHMFNATECSCRFLLCKHQLINPVMFVIVCGHGNLSSLFSSIASRYISHFNISLSFHVPTKAKWSILSAFFKQVYIFVNSNKNNSEQLILLTKLYCYKILYFLSVKVDL